jgi:hypothetical protein
MRRACRSLRRLVGAEGITPITHYPGQHVDRRPGRQSIVERHDDDLVAAARSAVPGPVLAGDRPESKSGGQRRAAGPCKALRGRVRHPGIVRCTRFGYEDWALRFDARIDIRTVVAVRLVV